MIDHPLRCEVTANPCGTDTWAVGYVCPCTPCQTWHGRWTAQDESDGYSVRDLVEWLHREAERKRDEGLHTHQRRLLACANRLNDQALASPGAASSMKFTPKMEAEIRAHPEWVNHHVMISLLEEIERLRSHLV